MKAKTTIPYSDNTKVSTSFTIDPELLKDAKDYCYMKRMGSFSGWVEGLVLEKILPAREEIKAFRDQITTIPIQNPGSFERGMHIIIENLVKDGKLEKAKMFVDELELYRQSLQSQSLGLEIKSGAIPDATAVELQKANEISKMAERTKKRSRKDKVLLPDVASGITVPPKTFKIGNK